MALFLGSPKVQYFDSNGDPLSGGKLYVYDPGTTNAKDSYPTIADMKAGTNANANPVILDSRGEANVVLAGKSKLVLTDADDTTVWTMDNVNDADIVDNNGNELVSFTTTSNAVNYLTVTNAATGNNVTLDTAGDDATPNLTIQADGGSGTVTINGLDLSSASFTTPLIVDGTSASAAQIRLAEDTDNGTNYVAWSAATSIATSYTVTLPAAAPTTNSNVLSVNTDGSSSWTSLALDSDVKPNLLLNGGFQIAQRTGPFTAAATFPNNDDSYLFDQWILLSDGNDIVDLSRQTSAGATPDGTAGSCFCEVETASKKFGLLQILESSTALALRGETVSVSVDARTGASNALSNIRIGIMEWTGATDAPTSDLVSTWESTGVNPVLVSGWDYANTPTNHALTSSFQTFTVEGITLSSSITNLGVFIWSDDTTGSAVDDQLFLAKIKLEKNDTATAWEEPNIQEELIKCQRYFEIHGRSGSFPRLSATAHIVGTIVSSMVTFNTPKRTTSPTVTKVGTWSTTNANQPSVDAENGVGYQLSCTATTSSGAFSASANSTSYILITDEL